MEKDPSSSMLVVEVEEGKMQSSNANNAQAYCECTNALSLMLKFYIFRFDAKLKRFLPANFLLEFWIVIGLPKIIHGVNTNHSVFIYSDNLPLNYLETHKLSRF